MGARTVFSFETEPGEFIHLYSHSGGETKMNDLAKAIDRARPRWEDETYALRIMVSQLIGHYWGEQTGYGLWTQHQFEESYEPTEINVRHKSVRVNETLFTFNEFISEYGGTK